MAATATIDQAAAEVARLGERYDVRGTAEVTAFVRDHPEVVPLLFEAVEVVPRYFGERAGTALEVERDREAEDHRLLFGLIEVDLDVARAVRCWRRFQDDRWLDESPWANRHPAFAVEDR